MLSFLHRWDCCWKCQFDTDVKTENYNHHDGEQLYFKKKFIFFKKVHIKTQRKKKDVLAIFILLLYKPLYYCKKQRTLSCLIKTVLKRNLNRTLFHNSTGKKFTWMNRNWTGKLPVTLLSTYISWKKLCSQTFKACSEEVILMYSEKINAKCMKKDVWKIFFLLTCRLVPASGHLATS